MYSKIYPVASKDFHHQLISRQYNLISNAVLAIVLCGKKRERKI
jgi:hypothetical protein